MPPAPDDPAAHAAAQAILERHDLGQAEDNIRAAARDFLIAVQLAAPAEIEVEAPAGDGGRCDLTTADVIFEFKRRIGAKPGLQPDPVYVDQLDRYLASARDNALPQRVGILTDGRNWIARWPDMAGLRTDAQYAHELKSADGWLELYRWLSDVSQALEARGIPADDDEVRRRLGPGPRFQQHLAELRALYDANRDRETIRVKRELWRRLLSAALGVAVEEEPDLDGLFLRHTYLSVVVGLAVQSAFGIDILAKAASEPADLIEGRIFQDETGVRGVVESDFFGWPAEVGGERWLQGMARRVQHFDWRNAESDIARILYESVIPAEDRRRLGEYYTPLWLARAIVDEVVQQPLEQTVLDPACGSGTFIYAAVERFLAAAREADWSAERTLDRLPTQVQGIDVHPVSVHLARATWTFAARSALERARDANVPVATVAPIYLGDSLQLRTAGQDLFSRDRVRIEIDDDDDRHLDFPLSLVQQSDWFDQTMIEISEAIENRDDPLHALDKQGITEDVSERGMLEQTVATMEALHAEGRDHIWGYYTRNMVRPTMLSESKVDAIVGNPPWLTYNKTQAIVRSELERQSKSFYGIWTGGRYATHQDVAGLFFTRCVDLYLEVGGSIGMVMPQSALQTGQYREWRTGAWNRVAADLAWREPWDLERIEPNTFFPVPSCVVFAERLEEQSGESRRTPRGLPASASQWLGPEGGPYQRENVALRDTSGGYASPYGERARQGATIVPRCLFFVEEEESDAGIAADVVRVRARRGAQDKEPWRSLDLAKIDNRPIEREYVWDVHLGETVAPYVLLDPLRAVLPMTPDAPMIERDEHGIHGVARDTLKRNVARRWREINKIWDENKASSNQLNLVSRLDYVKGLSAQRERLGLAGSPARRLAGSPLNSIRSLANIQRSGSADGDDTLGRSSGHRIETLHDSMPVETRGTVSNGDHQLSDAGRRGGAADVQGTVRGTGRSQAPLENPDSRVRRRDTAASGSSTSRSTTHRRGKGSLGRDSSGPSSEREEHISDDRSASAAGMASRVANREASGTDSHAVDPLNRPAVFYASSGRPTAAIGFGPSIVESTLYWIECDDWAEAYYISAVINSTALWDSVIPLAPKNWAGNSRHVQKHLWRLPIPEFDPDESLHLEIAEAGADAAIGAESVWREIEAKRRAAGKSVSVTIARREIRAWLAESAEGKRVEVLVERLLSPP